MDNKNKFNHLLVGSYTEAEYDAWNHWCVENPMLANSVGYFSMLFLGPPADDELEGTDPAKAFAENKVQAMPLMTTLYRFAYDRGLSRALNLMMMQATAVERQKSPLLQARMLSFAVRWAAVEDRPLHLL